MFRSGIDNPKFANDQIHSLIQCTSCHGGVDGTADRDAAHAQLRRIPGADRCSACHADAAFLASTSLHTTSKGMENILVARGFDFSNPESRARFDKQCAKCHLANAEGEAACGHCHVSVPDSAGGGLVAGHRMSRTPNTESNCTACHGSRVKDEYFGLNQALFARNLEAKGSTIPADYVFRGTTLKPDVHKAAAMGCEACHYREEMHGSGVVAGDDRYGVTGRTECRDCHVLSNDNVFHLPMHVDNLACQVCHAQPYKQCFGCHTDEKADSKGLMVGYFENNGTDPTRLARTAPDWSAATTYAKDVYVTHGGVHYRSLAASNMNHQPGTAGSEAWWLAANPTKLVPGDGLITFRVGKNPRYGKPGAPKYAVLRHAPVDSEVFDYSGANAGAPQVTGLIPVTGTTNLASLPTWKYATPHNIQRNTLITTAPAGGGTACDNCHSARYTQFWLTDPIGNAFGWVPDPTVAGNEKYQFEADANVDTVVPVPPPMN